MLWAVKLTSTPAIQVVVLVLENNQGDILLTQRKQDQYLAGYWEFPGGKVEHKESLLEALNRECQEELGYVPKHPVALLETNHTYPEVQVTLHVFHDINPNAQVFSAEQQKMQWFHKSDLPNIKLPPANQIIVENLLNAEES